MGSNLKKSLCAFILIFSLCNAGINAQLLDDTAAVSLIKSGIDKIYNLQFDEAEEIYTEIKRLYKDHPVEYLYHGIMVYWQNYPLLPSSPSRNIFEDDMKKCIRLSEKKPYSKDHEAEALLGDLCSRGLLLLFYADNEMSINVIPVASSTYKYIMRSFEFNSVYADLYYFTGLYNYYRDAYPRFHPVYKAVAALFPPGNIQTGLNELNIATKNAIILRAESYSILAWIYTFYENNYPVSLTYTRALCEHYPANPYFRSLHIKNLILMQKYDEAETYLEVSGKTENKYYSAEMHVYNALIQEKKYKNNEMARRLYEEGLNELAYYGEFGKEFSAYAWFGLSRINESSGNKAEAKKCHRKAMDLADFKNINFD
jgi:hypothetical protein